MIIQQIRQDQLNEKSDFKRDKKYGQWSVVCKGESRRWDALQLQLLAALMNSSPTALPSVQGRYMDTSTSCFGRARDLIIPWLAGSGDRSRNVLHDPCSPF